MSDPVIPYATAHETRRFSERDAFGVVVRAAGLLMILWGFYTFMYLINVQVMHAPTGGHSVEIFLITATFWIVGGAALLRGEWLVRLAYGRSI